jgi:hypothetical protein
MNIPAGRYRYVKINRWKDQRISAGQAMFLCDPKEWQVTTCAGELWDFVGVSLQDHRYYWWEYALWLLTRMVRFSPIRYVFIQQSGNIKLYRGGGSYYDKVFQSEVPFKEECDEITLENKDK